ncbi:MAG: 3-oxoacyl-ACP synthase III family protein, partial [Thermocrispum sp.]
MAIGMIGLGGHVPERVVGNAEISRWTGAPEEWVAERTGIEQRRYAGQAATSDLAAAAAERALAAVPGAREQLSAIIVATCTPDRPQPSTGAVLQHKLGLKAIPAFDVNAVCSGFLYALTVAEGLLCGRLGGGQVLVVGADKFSAIMDRTDRRTVSLFGDGAGAAVVAAVPDGYGIAATTLVTDGDFHDYVYVEDGVFRMDGRAVREYALTTLRKVVAQTLDDAGIGLHEVDRFVFHQANTRLIEAFADDIGVDRRRFALTAPSLGNTAAASLPLTLVATHRNDPLRRGERVLLAAVGGGMTAGASLLTW